MPSAATAERAAGGQGPPRPRQVAFWSFYEEVWRDNGPFRDPNLGLGELATQRFFDLYPRAIDRGYRLATLDTIEDLRTVDCFVFSDFPRLNNPLVRVAFETGRPRILIIEECEVVRRANWAPSNHRLFDSILTWHDGYVDNRKYFKYNTYFIETRTIPRDLAKKTKLCTIIASNKRAVHPLELYSERRRAIRWFERHRPEDFDLYGYGWDQLAFPHDVPFIDRLNSSRLYWLRRALREKFPSWRGTVARKKEVLSRYRFALAFENARDIPGYILEKIFQVFSAGTVPVYRGANNVTDHIPGDCFIDLREFPSYAALYDRLRRMSDAEYLRYIDSIEAFLNSERAQSFSTAAFASTLMGRIDAVVTARAA